MLFTLGIRNIIKDCAMKLKDFLNHLSIFLLVAVLLSSCVGNKELVYLQDKEAKGAERYSNEVTFRFELREYHLRKGDVILPRIKKMNISEHVFKVESMMSDDSRNMSGNPYLQGNVVRDDGSVEIPLLGEFKAEGLTIDSLRDNIAQELARQIPGSTIELFLLDGMVTVIGEVQSPGRYPLFKYNTNVFSLLGMSGDMLSYANRKEVKVLRFENEQVRTYVLDLTDENVLRSELFFLQNDDVVIVSPLKRKKYTNNSFTWVLSGITSLVALGSLIITITR